MNHNIDSSHRLAKTLSVVAIAHVPIDTFRHVLSVTANQIVATDYSVAALEEGIREMTTQKAGDSRHEYAHDE
jgi:uncharacterized protein (DUF486 family)